MAGESGETTAGAEALKTMADELEFLDWSCDLMGVERIQTDPEDDDSEDIFEVKFQVAGPNANAEVEIIVSDAHDEAAVMAIAFDTLHRAMKAWGGITEDRRIAARDVDKLKG